MQLVMSSKVFVFSLGFVKALGKILPPIPFPAGVNRPSVDAVGAASQLFSDTVGWSHMDYLYGQQVTGYNNNITPVTRAAE